jgi:pyruvate/2-oxoglutarate dehydrogenase complex dihydrolipoamide dehydrogenase (E3) component
VTIVGAGPAGLAAAAEALARGHRVVLFEQRPAVGGQLRLYADAPGQQELGRSLLHNYKWLEHAPDLTLRLGARATADAVGETEPDLIVLACGAEPYVPPLDLGDVDALQAWDVLGGARPAGRVLVADWGGDPSGLDSAEVLAAAGAEVTLAVAAWGAGEGLHHYRRSHYLGRLYGAGVEVLHHVELAGAGPEGVRLRNIYEPAVETVRAVDAVVIAHGRVPAEAPDVDGLGVPVRRVGDHAGPRSLEEAVLEGTTVVAHSTGRPRPSIATAGAAA